MTSPILGVGIVLWGLFMIVGAVWAAYAARRARDRDATDGTGAGDADEDDRPAGPQIGGYLVAALVVLLGLVVVGIGVWSLL